MIVNSYIQDADADGIAIDIEEGIVDNMNSFWQQLVSISYATQALFLGNAYLQYPVTISTKMVLTDNRTAARPSFLDLEIPAESNDPVPEFIWGDVLKGIEEMSHNVTAALLTLQLGNMSSECFFDQQDVIYQYSSVALWVPYGVSDFSLLSSYDLTFS
jgi:hypothetical protein